MRTSFFSILALAAAAVNGLPQLEVRQDTSPSSSSSISQTVGSPTATAAPGNATTTEVGPSSIVPGPSLGAGADPSTAHKNISSTYQPNSSFMVKEPTYQVFSNFDFQSINLALHQEYIELDLFNYILAKFSDQEFRDANLTAEDQELIRYMGQQEIGHAQVLTDMLGPRAAKPCNYTYPFSTVRQSIDFSQQLTRWGESGVYGFLNLLDNRAVGQILLQSITTEARQQMVFRQFEGLFPMPVWFEAGVPQAWAWTLLQEYITECPEDNEKLAWDVFPKLTVTNRPDALTAGEAAGGAAITHNVSALSYPGRESQFTFEAPGKTTGPNQNYTTSTMTNGVPKFAAWVSQLNVTYTPLYDVNSSYAATKQPNGRVITQTGNDFINNGTMFVALTDTDLYVTPANLTLINKHVVAGPAIFIAG